MQDGKCSKKFPKALRETTESDGKGQMRYRRRDAGRTIHKRVRGTVIALDNRWVVPYNAFLVGKYDCHINVEVCSSVQTVKYLHKYVFKGPDPGVLDASGNIDEINQYLEGRYIAPQEAYWRIFGFTTNSISHNVVRLTVHLPGQQYMAFRAQSELQDVLERNEKTTLTEFFAMNRDAQAAGEPLALTYPEFPLHYIWEKSRKKWKLRQNNRNVLSRVNIAPAGSESFYLRMLLHHVVAPESFEDVRTVNGIVQPTFKAAAIARNLLQDDSEWDSCLREATIISMPRQIRRLFATLLVYGELSDPVGLLRAYLDAMSEDMGQLDEQSRHNRCIAEIDNLLTG
jgi:hypothetical protein